MRQDKGTPFILIDSDGERKKEQLEYTNKIHVLITRELGNMVFPICAELLDPVYYPLVTNAARADTILCPSFSPGIGAFSNTLVKGLASKMLSIWANTCSAQSVSANKRISDVLGSIQSPDASISAPLLELKRECKGQCSGGGCYFEVDIVYENREFYIESRHHKCA